MIESLATWNLRRLLGELGGLVSEYRELEKSVEWLFYEYGILKRSNIYF